MSKEDWIGFIIACFLFALIEIIIGSFNLTLHFIASILVIAIWKLINIFRK